MHIFELGKFPPKGSELSLCPFPSGLYTDESPGLKVDPVVVLVLSLGFIFSVVALHGRSFFLSFSPAQGEMGWDVADW